jgi:hypothetical protein
LAGEAPLAHVGGLGVVTRALLTGTPLTFDATDPAATLTAAVPTQLERDDHARFRAVLVGGSADWRSDRPANIVRTYGLTESGGGVVYDGRPLDGVDVRVADDGEIWLRSPTLLRCYRDGTDPKDDGGWLPTGDDGAWDAKAGRLTVHGRRGDVIVTGGEKVWPDPVERDPATDRRRGRCRRRRPCRPGVGGSGHCRRRSDRPGVAALARRRCARRCRRCSRRGAHRRRSSWSTPCLERRWARFAGRRSETTRYQAVTVEPPMASVGHAVAARHLDGAYRRAPAIGPTPDVEPDGRPAQPLRPPTLIDRSSRSPPKSARICSSAPGDDVSSG